MSGKQQNEVDLHALCAHNVSVTVDGHALISNVSLDVGYQKLIAVLGPNGAGKTTLLRAMAGIQAPSSGEVHLSGKPLSSYNSISRGRALAYLAQQRSVAWPNLVHDVVALGRFSYGAALHAPVGADAHAIDQALQACGLEALAQRSVETLSGGEQARVHCARAFATQAPVVLADEPISNLDPMHQHRVLGLLRDYTVPKGRAVLVVLHDINLALQYADQLVWMKQGEIVSIDAPDAVTAQRIESVYGVTARRVDGDGVIGDQHAPPQFVFYAKDS